MKSLEAMRKDQLTGIEFENHSSDVLHRTPGHLTLFSLVGQPTRTSTLPKKRNE